MDWKFMTLFSLFLLFCHFSNVQSFVVWKDSNVVLSCRFESEHLIEIRAETSAKCYSECQNIDNCRLFNWYIQ